MMSSSTEKKKSLTDTGLNGEPIMDNRIIVLPWEFYTEPYQIMDEWFSKELRNIKDTDV